MKSRDLLNEYLAAMRAMTLDDARQLMRVGIQVSTIEKVCPVPIRATVHGGLYVPDAEGSPAWMLPVTIVDPDQPDAIECSDPERSLALNPLIDLCLFSPAAPRRWALRCAFASALGAIEPQYLDPKPVPVHRDITEWLRADCEGIVLLTFDGREAARVLWQIHVIEAEDRQHAAELRDIMTAPIGDPIIRVRPMRRAAA